MPGWEGERRAAIPQMRGYLSYQRNARNRIIFQVKELFASVGKCVEKRTVQRDDLQVCAVERCKQTQRVCHAGVVRECQKRAGRDPFLSNDMNALDVMPQGQSRSLGQRMLAHVGIELNHRVGERLRRRQEDAAQEPRQKRPVLPTEGGNKIIQINLRQGIYIGCCHSGSIEKRSGYPSKPAAKCALWMRFSASDFGRVCT